jgi:hypothetical protein
VVGVDEAGDRVLQDEEQRRLVRILVRGRAERRGKLGEEVVGGIADREMVPDALDERAGERGCGQRGDGRRCRCG